MKMFITKRGIHVGVKGGRYTYVPEGTMFQLNEGTNWLTSVDMNPRMFVEYAERSHLFAEMLNSDENDERSVARDSK